MFSFVYSFNKDFTVAIHVSGVVLILGDLMVTKNTDQAPGLMKFAV